MKWLLITGVLFTGCVGEIEGPNSVPVAAPAGLDPNCDPYLSLYQASLAPKSFPVDVVIDGHITDHNIGLVLDAIDSWNTRMKSEVLYATITDHLDRHGMCNYTTLVDNVDLPAPYIGLTVYGDCANDTVNIETMSTGPAQAGNPFYNDLLVTQIGIHELGHVLGLDHEPTDPTSIMFPNLGGDPRVISQQSYCLVQIARSKAQ